MSAENIEARVARVIADAGGLQLAAVKSDSTLPALGLDDLDEVEILINLEDEFGITIPDELDHKSVAEICAMVQALTGALA